MTIFKQLLNTLNQSSPHLNINYEWKDAKWVEQRANAIKDCKELITQMTDVEEDSKFW
jgi:hypothetical protein